MIRRITIEAADGGGFRWALLVDNREVAGGWELTRFQA